MELQALLALKESEDGVEFKAAKNNFKYAGGANTAPKDRRHCVLGYVTAFCNEGGGMLVLGISNEIPHSVVGTNFSEGWERKLEDDIYRDTDKIRVRTEVMYEDAKRVLIIHIPKRPFGKAMKFEGAYLMRIGESLREMSDAELANIMAEQEPDFSVKICSGLQIAHLDPVAVSNMKKAYAKKQKNPSFTRLSTEQVLKDLNLSTNKGLTYAALILLAKSKEIERFLPNAKSIWEFRFSTAQISYDFRETISDPLFLAIDQLWGHIDNKNAEIPVRYGAYVSTLRSFNEDVIREAVLNAFAHRDYTITSEVVIKQYPRSIIISNPGGFPKGVSIENILTVNSTPRCRLIAEVLEKTGLVERSGQGVDKIFSITLSEGKSEPDYSKSDPFQVTLKLEANITDKAFAVYIAQIQNAKGEFEKLGVEDIVTLYKIKTGSFTQVNSEVLARLEKEGLIIKASGHSKRYTLTDDYYQMASKEQRIGTRYVIIELEHFLLAIQTRELRLGGLQERLIESLNQNQIRYLIKKLTEDNVIESRGQGRGTTYRLKSAYKNLVGEALSTTVFDRLKRKHDR